MVQESHHGDMEIRARRWAERCEKAHDEFVKACKGDNLAEIWRWNNIWRNARNMAIELEIICKSSKEAIHAWN